uniref:Uncharacterized LOC100178654 n=1 Tax=Ciona intestinalis TaxID=7719 RepID=F6XFR1_CIOIN|nr:uncharacterized protein LOC100178654 [Ciona intestinalis]|eukprot:XP_002130536.1 uncharacterized protein LOC100178654 [Ciona intestinalis]
MAARLKEDERRRKYQHYADSSPLKTSISEEQIRKLVDGKFSEQKTRVYTQNRGRSFILDGVREHVHKSNVVPSYNAFNDRHAQTYFRQPAVQDMLKRAAATGTGQLIPAFQTFKLSKRNRLPVTPGVDERVKRERKFVVDSIRVDSLKSRRYPVIPKYNALDDIHAKTYFKKKSVRNLLLRTCDLKI